MRFEINAGIIIMNAAAGKVYLIGAGPGDPGLITAKGKELLESCEAVIYDYLVPSELIVCLPESVELHYAGKRGGHASTDQDEINQLMVRLAQQGKRVARLKGGDPFIFGRGGEEAEYLRLHGVDFEIVPGVTAGVAAPAYAGIPITDRRYSSYLVFATGHKSKHKTNSSVPWKKLASLDDGTLIIYMGVEEIDTITKILIENGMSPDMPAAIIERGTESNQITVTSRLSELAESSTKTGIKPPAIIVIGNVVGLRNLVSWFEKMPLFSVRVMVTRPVDLARPFYSRLRELGAEVLACPTIATAEYFDGDAWKKLARRFNNQMTDIWLIFTSQNGVRHFLTQLKRQHDLRMLSKVKIAAIGEGTKSELCDCGLKPDFIPDKATVADMAEQLPTKYNLDRALAIRVRGNLGDDLLEKSLSKVGAEVVPFRTYTTFYPRWPEGIKEKVLEYPPHAIIFTSSSTVDGLFEILGDSNARSIAEQAAIFSIGPSTSKKIVERGLKVACESREHSVEDLTNLLIKKFAGKGN